MSRPRNEGESRVQSFRREWGYPHHDDGDDDDDHDDGDDDDDDDDDGDQAVPTQKPGQVAILNPRKSDSVPNQKPGQVATLNMSLFKDQAVPTQKPGQVATLNASFKDQAVSTDVLCRYTKEWLYRDTDPEDVFVLEDLIE